MNDDLDVRTEFGSAEIEQRAPKPLSEHHELEGLLAGELNPISTSVRSAEVTLAWLCGQLRRLQALADELGTADTTERVAKIAVHYATEIVDATNGVFYLTEADGGHAKITHWRAPSDANRLLLGRVSSISAMAVANGLGKGTPTLLASTSQLSIRCPASDAPTCEQVFGGALGLLPLVVEGRTAGMIALAFDGAREFSEHERSVLTLLGSHCAEALRRVRVVEQERETTLRAEAAAQNAEDASRLKDEFLTTVSHELRTPLSAILGWSMLLRRERRVTAASLDKGLEVIERNARAQQRIIEDILDVSQIVRGKFRIKRALVNLEAIANEVSDSLRSAASARNVELVLSAPGGPHQMYGDADRLRQILWNLLSNAVKFTPSGGTVKLQIARVGEEMAMTVRDTGDGIEPDFLPFVFQHFRQADGTTTRAHGGLGLGLAMVRHLAEMHGGTVTAQSEGAGKGATFTVLLPMGTAH